MHMRRSNTRVDSLTSILTRSTCVNTIFVQQVDPHPFVMPAYLDNRYSSELSDLVPTCNTGIENTDIRVRPQG